MLDWVAERWATPMTSDALKGGPNQAFGRGNPPLVAQALKWETPRTVSGGYTRDRGDPSQTRLTMEGQALAFSLPDRPISTDGEEHSHIRRTLNPLFVEWLMGWPPGWTSLALTPPASTGFACSGTGLSVWKRRMRSALSSLASPHAVPPAQLSLFA